MVKREKFLEDAKAEPARFYRTPNDVLRDRRLSDADRRAILQAWESRMREGEGEDALIEQVHRALSELSDGDDDGADTRHRSNG